MFRTIAIILLITGAALAVWFLIFGGYFSGKPLSPDASKAREIQPFFTGLVVPLLTLGSTLLVFENLRLATRQNFSTNFLKLLDQHHKLVDNINTTVEGISTEDKPSKARALFDDLALRIAIDYQYLPANPEAIKKLKYKPNEDIKVDAKDGVEKLGVIFDYYYHILQSDLGHYFGNLYNILEYAHINAPNDDQKANHIKILRGQLSNYELLILAYGALGPYGEKFKTLIEKYELLKYINTEENLPESWEKRIVDLDILRNSYPHFNKYHPETTKPG